MCFCASEGSTNRIQNIKQELDLITNQNKGILTPLAVVKYAKKNKQSALHREFTWDIKQAASEYWLYQARQIILSVYVEVIPNGSKEPISCRAFVSLASDRIAGGGYRKTFDVVMNVDQNAELLEQAKEELKRVRDKYRTLQGLAEAIDNILNSEIFATERKTKVA